MQKLYDLYYRTTILLCFIRDLFSLEIKDDDDIYYFPMQRVDQQTKEVQSWAIVVTTDARYAWEIEGEITDASAQLADTELRDSA